jgi:hypothetical protein
VENCSKILGVFEADYQALIGSLTENLKPKRGNDCPIAMRMTGQYWQWHQG